MKSFVLAGLLALGLAAPARADDMPLCPSVPAPPIVLPRLRKAIAANQEVTIVALGSSSTAGWHATDIAHSYPAILQQQLNAALPAAHIAVINRGVGGQDVLEMLGRIDTDAIALHPTLVIWQLGANGAMRHVAPDLFKRLLAQGVRRLRDAKIDVLLMGNQRAPAILAAPEHTPIEHKLSDVAAEQGVALFERGILMDRWKDAGYPYDLFMSDDGVHHNDRGYRCVAQALASAMIEGLKQPPSATVAAKK